MDRNAPNLVVTARLDIVPDAASPSERVVITLRVTNEGTRDAPKTRVTLQLPVGLTYLPGSLRVDNVDPIPGDEVINPLRAGLSLGNIPFRGDNDRVIVLRAAIDAGVQPGTRLLARGQLTTDTLEAAVQTNEATLTVLGALQLGQSTKIVRDETVMVSMNPVKSLPTSCVLQIKWSSIMAFVLSIRFRVSSTDQVVHDGQRSQSFRFETSRYSGHDHSTLGHWECDSHHHCANS